MSPYYVAALLGFILAAVIVAIALKPKVATLVDEAKPKPNLMDPSLWVIGPVYNGQPNPSKGMPLHPVPTSDGFAIPFKPFDEAHYATINYGSLHGKSRIVIKGYIEGGPFVAASDRTSLASLCLYFQRIGDDWNETDSDPYNDSDTESYRWWATPKALMPMTNGAFELSASFAELWTACEYSESLGVAPKGKPGAFKAAMDNAGEVGLTFGGGTGWGHGATTPTGGRVVITSVEIS